MMAIERLNPRSDADFEKNLKRSAIRKAIVEADKGVFVSQEKIDAWVSSWGTNSELPPPEPDIFPDPK